MIVSREMGELEPLEIPTPLIELFRSTVEGLAAKGGAQNLLSKLHNATRQGMLVYPIYHAFIDVLNNEGDARITFLFEISNFGLAPFSSSACPIWFGQAQDEVDFYCRDADGEPLTFEIVRASATFREIRVFFRRPLEALETMRLKISFQVKGVFVGDCFYCLRPRVLTNTIGLTVLGPENVDFETADITRESPDGFMRNQSPTISLSRDGRRTKLNWDFRSPTSGDLFRTSWSYANGLTDANDASRQSRVVDFRPSKSSKSR